jgi:hypothetical protein
MQNLEQFQIIQATKDLIETMQEKRSNLEPAKITTQLATTIRTGARQNRSTPRTGFSNAIPITQSQTVIFERFNISRSIVCLFNMTVLT